MVNELNIPHHINARLTAGLMSRWMILALCKQSSAEHNCCAMILASDSATETLGKDQEIVGMKGISLTNMLRLVNERTEVTVASKFHHKI